MKSPIMQKLPNKIRFESLTGPYRKAFSTKAISKFWSRNPTKFTRWWLVMDTSNSNPPGSYYVWLCPTRKVARDLVWYHKRANLSSLSTPVKYYYNP